MMKAAFPFSFKDDLTTLTVQTLPFSLLKEEIFQAHSPSSKPKKIRDLVNSGLSTEIYAICQGMDPCQDQYQLLRFTN
jgi:hypothetical protein